MFVHPVPDLVWDTVPHQFQTGLCDTFPPPNTPQGRYKVVLSFPGSNRGIASSSITSAELHAGLNVVNIGPWIPGFDPHMASCATRAYGETQIMYSDNPENVYRALDWPDGRDKIDLAILCGGNYP